MADGQVVFEIDADKRKALAAIDDVTKDLSKAGKQWEGDARQSTDSIGNGFASMFTKISAAAIAATVGKTLYDWGKAAIDTASDLQEVQNVIDVTFGDGASTIETWAKSAGEQFGLTELQAKQFTSTLGAMMKSSGLAGDEIIGMSTDLAGLAADMASFYNLDFETAFQKIRAGISGETEPLKQLGVNMSVANLEAYALTQGITKSFDEMSSGEQTMLRYQYLMQATADAQGDFARTAGDSFANMQRRMETSISTIKAKIGETLLPIVSDATGAIADFLTEITKEKPHTVLDDFAEIDLHTADKIAAIQATADEAGALLTTLKEINTDNGLTTDGNVFKYMDTLTSGITALDSAAANQEKIGSNLTALAEGLSPEVSGDGKLAESIGGVTQAIGDVIGALDGNKIPEDVKKVADGLNPTPANDGALVQDIGGVESAIDGLEKKLDESDVVSDVAGLADGLNPTVDGTIGDKVAEVTGSIGDLEKKLDESDVSGGIAGLAEDIDPEVKGDFAAAVKDVAGAIDTLDTAAAEAEATATAIEGVAGAIGELPTDTNAGTAVGAVSEGLNKLQAGKAVIWRSMYNVLKDIDALNGIFTNDAAGNVSALATALSTDAPDGDRAAAWEAFLDALGANAGALSALTGQDAEGAAEWLKTVKAALDDAKIDSGSVDAWSRLMGVFAEGLSEENKGAFTDTIVDELLAMGNKSEYAREALAALGFQSDDIADAQEQWLLTCQRLVQTIPGLSSIINTQTGEVEGGADAVREYINAWEEGQTKLAFQSAYQQKQTAISQRFADLPGLELDMRVAEKRARDNRSKIDAILKKYGLDGYEGTSFDTNIVTGYGISKEDSKLYASLMKTQESLDKAANKATAEYEKQKAALDEAQAAMQEYEAFLDDMPDAIEETAAATDTLSKAMNGDADAISEVEAAVKNANDALQALADYQQNVRDQVDQTVKSVVNGFSKIETPATKARNEVADLTKALEKETDKEKRAELEKQKASLENSAPSIHSMTEGLESQLEYMREYQKMLTTAREKGVSEDLLAALSDGSQESFDYLYALTQYEGNIEALNKAYADVQAEAEAFTGTLTEQKLAVDDTYATLVDKAAEAVNGLNLGDTAYENVSATLQGIIDACGDQSEAIKSAVDSIAAQLSRLQGLGGIHFGSGFSFGGGGLFRYFSNANGIDNVPYDGYLALLHQGERVQTAAEADLARRYSYQQPGFDYASMGGAIGSGIGRGNVYLDGRTVGEVLSSRQANSYRAMERSGWQG